MGDFNERACHGSNAAGIQSNPLKDCSRGTAKAWYSQTSAFYRHKTQVFPEILNFIRYPLALYLFYQIFCVETAFLVIKIRDLKIWPGTHAPRTARTVFQGLDCKNFDLFGA